MPSPRDIAAVVVSLAGICAAQEFHPDIPKAWDDKEVERFEIPLAQRDRSPRYMTAKEYYALKIRPIYRSYPAYLPGREPAAYIESLKQKDPEIIFDPSKLHTKQDWVAAGKIVFEAEILLSPAPARAARLDGIQYYPVSKDGVLPGFVPGFRYYIRKKGVLEVGAGTSCAGCHTRVMPDGSLFEGAQGSENQPDLGLIGFLRKGTPEQLHGFREELWIDFGVPWILSKDAYMKALTREEMIRLIDCYHPGVVPRQGTSMSQSPHVPSLIGIQDIEHLDTTGLVHHRTIGDLMRYSIVNQGLDTMAYYGDFQPSPHSTAFGPEEGTRYSDEQLYALALYLYSLKPPPNPNPVADRARHGQKIFNQQGCVGCHAPPLYTNNKLTPAVGFKVPEDLLNSGEVLNFSVGTDPTLALESRRGTGFYKIPSLRGVWYRNAFGHGGQAETLEEWFDPARLKSDYVPKGFHSTPGPIIGHEFGLKLSTEDRQDLIAFLQTL